MGRLSIKGGLLRGWTLRGEWLAALFAARDPEAPLPLRLLALGVCVYVLSPIDVVPDVLPLLGWLDDWALASLGLGAVMRWMPAPVKARAQERASKWQARHRHWGRVVLLVLGLWLIALIAGMVWLLSQLF